jgi:drug/metabolite transporter (DMT)-like permease
LLFWRRSCSRLRLRCSSAGSSRWHVAAVRSRAWAGWCGCWPFRFGLLGTVVLLLGYATQGAALDRGKLVVVQPLLVTTIVWALPLGYWLTAQTVVRRQVLGAGVVVIGLALFVLVGDPDAGVENASTQSLVLAVLIVSAVVAGLLVWLRTQTAAALRAAVLGVCAGLFFGLSAVFTKPVLNDLQRR